LLSYSAIVNPLWKAGAETTTYCAWQLWLLVAVNDYMEFQWMEALIEYGNA